MQISKFPLWICALTLCAAPALRAVDTPAQSAARAALEQKMNELDTDQSSATPAPASPAPAAVPAAPAATVAAPVVETPAPAPTASPAEAASAPATPVAETPAPVVAAPAVVKNEATVAIVKPAPATSAPVTLSKEERLQLLLARYKADQITPLEYHTQRAAIIAEP